MAPNETKWHPRPKYIARNEVDKADQKEKHSTVNAYYEANSTLMDHPVRRLSMWQWIKGKVEDDNIGPNLWRVGDKLYDLTPFISLHPGGAQWLELSKGTDITEAFNTCHVFIDRAEAVLAKYFVRDCPEIPRRSPFTFEKDGFYYKLRARAAEILKDVGTAPTLKMNLVADGILATFHVMMILTAVTGSYALAAITGLILGMNVAVAHNYLHQKDNLRRYYLDFAAFNSTDWRVSHQLSHHLFTNTYNDFEVMSMYPMVDFNNTKEKSFFHRFIGPVFYQIVFLLPAPLSFLHKFGQVLFGETKLILLDLMPFFQFGLMYLVSPFGAWTVFLLLTVIHLFCGWWVSFTALISTHHTPLAFHMGDQSQAGVNCDWGMHQIDCVRDVSGKNESFLLLVTSFGDHLLHHLFPVVDHSKLDLLYPALEETLGEFGLQYKFEHWWTMLKGIHVQLWRNYGFTYEEREAMRAGDRDDKTKKL